MKKFLSFLIVFALFIGLFSPSFIYAFASVSEASKSNTSESSSETEETLSLESETETEALPVILDTDNVSTEDIVLYSSACCVMDASTGYVLYYKNMNDVHYPASITKVLTGLLVIENADLDDTITFTSDCWENINYYDDMNIGMLDGEELSVEATLHAILLSSANEVCNGAAQYISGSIEAFVDLMNAYAAELGCTGSHFANPNGLHDDNHYTTAYDMALISSAAIQNETFRTITGTTSYTVDSTNLRPEGFVLNHKHKMLLYSGYHYDACIGGKTGYTSQAKTTLVTFAEKDGVTLACVTLENTNGTVYNDTTTALDYCFDNYELLAAAAEADDESSVEETSPEIEEIMETEDIYLLETAISDESANDNTSMFSQHIIDLAMQHLEIAILATIIIFFFLTLLIIWLRDIFRRIKHRSKYKQLRKDRLNKEKDKF